MYTLECIPPVNEAHIFKYDIESVAIEAAKELAEKHKVQVNVNKTIKRFVVKVVEEDA